jgi:hypothetical protein
LVIVATGDLGFRKKGSISAIAKVDFDRRSKRMFRVRLLAATSRCRQEGIELSERLLNHAGIEHTKKLTLSSASRRWAMQRVLNWLHLSLMHPAEFDNRDSQHSDLQ